MNLAIVSGLLLFVAMATATPSNHSLNFVSVQEMKDGGGMESLIWDGCYNLGYPILCYRKEEILTII